MQAIDEIRWKRWRLACLIVLIGSSALFGALDLFYYYSEDWTSASWFIHAIVGISALRTWCMFDSKLVRFPISGGLSFGIIFFALIAFPFYIVRSRSWKGAAKWGFGLPLFALSIGVYNASWWISEKIAVYAGYYG